MRREELGSLAMFLVVAKEKSFTKAAVKLGLSQSALSHSMRRLEEKLGIRLLTRTTRSVSLTEAGEQLAGTLGPALADIEAKVEDLADLRDKPTGTVRISTSVHAARLLIWPVVDKITAQYPDIRMEVNVASALTDIVAQQFDAGVRLGERLEQDMVAVKISPRLRMATVASPAYFEKYGMPTKPEDLTNHACINLRMMSGPIYAWEFDKDGREIKVKVDGQLVLNDPNLIISAAVAGHGITHLLEDCFTEQLADGSLVRVLEDWCEPFDGYYLYYPSRRQPSSAFKIVLEALRYRE